MTEKEAIERIHSVYPTGCKNGLENMRALMGRLGNPQEKLTMVHVAGTNGKGSCCAMIERVLRAAGYKTGLYTSPYIEVYNERIRINGEPIAGDKLAALVESRIRLVEADRRGGERFSLRLWRQDLRAALNYLRGEQGVRAIYGYMAVTNGIGNGYAPILVAFFRTAPGFTLAMYSGFSVAEFAGRTLGGLLHYHVQIPPKKRFSFAFLVYQFYELMDMLLLWLPYPLMLCSRAASGFLGVNSAALREAAVQRAIPDELRAKLNAFFEMLISLAMSVFSLLIGALGEVMDYRLCLTLCGAVCSLTCWATIWARRAQVRKIYERSDV